MSNILRRGRLENTLDTDIMQFTSSMKWDSWIFDADIMVDFAHTLMLAKQNIIDKKDAADILKGLTIIRDNGIDSLDHSYEDIHIALESRLIDIVGEETGGRMHSGRSRNDEVATCIRLTLREELLSLLDELYSLRVTLYNIAANNIETLMPGFTHLQHAQPTTFAHHLIAHLDSFGRDIARIKETYARVNLSPLGSAAFASTGFDINRKFTCELLGFDDIIENSMDGVSSRDFLIESASVIVNIMINLSRIAEELVIWSSEEFSFIELDDQYASTSSIMPQKKNPDSAELLRGKTGIVVGSLMGLITTCKALPLSYNRDLQEATPHVWQTISTIRSSVRIMDGMLKTMYINTDLMALKSTIGFTTATELADTIVRNTGIPFRTAHQIIGIIACNNSNPSLSDIDKISISVLNIKLSDKGLTEKLVQEALNPITNIKKRNVIGGPAFDTIRHSLNNREEILIKEKETIYKLKMKSKNALQELLNIVENYINRV